MHRFEIAEYATLLPPAERDRFALFANRTSGDRLRAFIRYQLQMRRQGFTPAAVPSGACLRDM